MSEDVKAVPEGNLVDANGNLTVEGRNLLKNFERILRDLQRRVAALENP